ncbi:hypothetical protein H5410_050344 [Solanum commersonii]|uniref:Uncharacterized protein n=1 Tax=Solanum commersonii TaxID=4109 RepID=A0A9J5WWS7_SOLCO|nr:hypothetical protein H5410_050344 [Solanum commersonii]
MNSDSRRIRMTLRSKSRCDALGSQIDTNALVSLERKPSFNHSSKNRTDRRVVMQEQMEKLEEDLRETREQLCFVEGEKKKAINELSEIKQVVHKASDGITSSELYEEIKDKNIKSLKLELEKAIKCDLKIPEKDVFSPVKTFKIRVTDWLSDFKRRVQELEDELENKKLLESKIFDAWLVKTRQFEKIKIELEESMLEIASLHEKIESFDTSYNGEIKNLTEKEVENNKSGFKLVKENEKIASSKAKALNDEMSLLKTEMKLANEAEERSGKALDDLALVLKEVSYEASEAKERLCATQQELGLVKKEVRNLKEIVKSNKARYKVFLDEAIRETELYRNTTERLKLEADESLSSWNGKEMSFIECIKEVQEERNLTLHEAIKLNESLKEAEQRSKAARAENYKLRDILKQAINETNAAKTGAHLARRENSQLKDSLAKTG